jgi:hypothetical protein
MYSLCHGQRQRRKYSSGLEDNKIVGYDFKQHQYEGFYSRKHFGIYRGRQSTRQRFWKTINAKSHLNLRGNIALHVEPDNPAKILYEN